MRAVLDDSETEAFASGIAAFIAVAALFLFWFSSTFEILLLPPFAIVVIVTGVFSFVFYRDAPGRAKRNARRMKLLKKLRKEEAKQRKKELKREEKAKKARIE